LGAALDLAPSLERQRAHLEAHLGARINELTAVAAELTQKNDRLLLSFSWRVTRPLRWVRGLASSRNNPPHPR
jgi:hypothetical protein